MAAVALLGVEPDVIPAKGVHQGVVGEVVAPRQYLVPLACVHAVRLGDRLLLLALLGGGVMDEAALAHLGGDFLQILHVLRPLDACLHGEEIVLTGEGFVQEPLRDFQGALLLVVPLVIPLRVLRRRKLLVQRYPALLHVRAGGVIVVCNEELVPGADLVHVGGYKLAVQAVLLHALA